MPAGLLTDKQHRIIKSFTLALTIGQYFYPLADPDKRAAFFYKHTEACIHKVNAYICRLKNIIAMKKLRLTLLLSTLFCSVFAQDLVTPQPSPTEEIKQNFGLSNIQLSYSRPSMKGRVIFGDLVPYGKVWRTGANSATTITFGEDVTIGGTKIPAGKYGILSIPDASEWTVIITKQTDVTSPAAYKQDQDVVRVKVAPQSLPFSIENFTMLFGNIKSNKCELQMLWDNVYVVLPIETDIDTKISAQIKDLMENDNRPYYAAAMYYMETGKDLNQAVAWLEKASQQNPTAFWIFYQKARALSMQGKKADAIAASNKSIELAKAAKNDDYVALNEKLQKSMK